MTKVFHLASRNAGRRTQICEISPTNKPAEALAPERQAVIENCLTMSLHFVRQPAATPADLWAATSRANRALTLLKQACDDARATVGRA